MKPKLLTGNRTRFALVIDSLTRGRAARITFSRNPVKFMLTIISRQAGLIAKRFSATFQRPRPRKRFAALGTNQFESSESRFAFPRAKELRSRQSVGGTIYFLPTLGALLSNPGLNTNVVALAGTKTAMFPGRIGSKLLAANRTSGAVVRDESAVDTYLCATDCHAPDSRCVHFGDLVIICPNNTVTGIAEKFEHVVNISALVGMLTEDNTKSKIAIRIGERQFSELGFNLPPNCFFRLCGLFGSIRSMAVLTEYYARSLFRQWFALKSGVENYARLGYLVRPLQYISIIYHIIIISRSSSFVNAAHLSIGLIEAGVIFYDDSKHLEIGGVKAFEDDHEEIVITVEEL